jgi:hypothetical protein
VTPSPSDGDAIPICRPIDGSFHVDGDIICSPLETVRAAFSQVVPLLKALPEVDKIFMTPLPRYLWRSCCADPQHAPNVKTDDHVVNMLADIEHLPPRKSQKHQAVQCWECTSGQADVGN